MQLSVTSSARIHPSISQTSQPTMQPKVKSTKIAARYPGETATARGRVNSSSEGCLHDHNTHTQRHMHTQRDMCTHAHTQTEMHTQKKCKRRHTFLPVQVGGVHWSNADQKSRDARAQAAPFASHSSAPNASQYTVTHLHLISPSPNLLRPVPSHSHSQSTPIIPLNCSPSPHLLILSLNPLHSFQLHPIPHTRHSSPSSASHRLETVTYHRYHTHHHHHYLLTTTATTITITSPLAVASQMECLSSTAHWTG